MAMSRLTELLLGKLRSRLPLPSFSLWACRSDPTFCRRSSSPSPSRANANANACAFSFVLAYEHSACLHPHPRHFAVAHPLVHPSCTETNEKLSYPSPLCSSSVLLLHTLQEKTETRSPSICQVTNLPNHTTTLKSYRAVKAIAYAKHGGE